MQTATPTIYRLPPEALPLEEKKMRSYFPVLLGLLLLAFAIVIFPALVWGTVPISKLTMLWIAFVVLCAVYFVPRRMKRRLRKCWETYELEIGPDYLCRRQGDISDLKVNFTEIKSIHHVPQRYLRVMSKQGLLAIPTSIEHFEEIVSRLSQIKPIEVTHIQEWQKSLGIILGSIMLFTAMLWSTSRSIGIPLVCATAIYLIWIFRRIRRNPNNSRGTKRVAWVYLLIVLFCAMKLLVLLTPPGPVSH